MFFDVKTTKTIFLTIVMMFQVSWLPAVEEKIEIKHHSY